MINKETVVKILAIILSLAMMLSLAGCGKPEKDPAPTETQTSKDDGVPDNLVPPITENTPEVTSVPDITGAPVVTGDPAAGTSAPDITEPPTPEVTDAPPAKTESTDNATGESSAMRYLRLINSSKVHTKFVEVSSYDGENIFSIGREIFVDGDSRLYINDSQRTLIRGGTVTIVDYDSKTYYTSPDEGGYGQIFGYSSDRYKHISTEENDTGYSEIYTISDTNITSTWTFNASGILTKVTDRSLDGGYFTIYSFELVDTDVSEMDFTIPGGFIEIGPEDLMI